MAAFAMVWVIYRAHLQSVTVDEADTYLFFVQPHWASQWYPSSNNHLLNSLLMRFFVSLFGLSHLTLRAPALIGGAVYIVAIFRLCLLLTNQELYVFPIFVAFVYNPFVMDFMVAARGYGLALGFLMLAVFFIARQIVANEPRAERALKRDCVLASICMGVSFTANFSFAYADVCCLFLFWLWACRRIWIDSGRSYSSAQRWARVLAWCAAPGLLAVFLIGGSVVANFPKSELYYGARSLSDTWDMIIKASFSGLNDEIVNPLLKRVLEAVLPYLPWVAIALCGLQIALFGWRRNRFKDPRQVWLAIFAGAAVLLTLSLHWLQFKIAGLPLPYKRTSIFFVPLSMLTWAAVTCAPRHGRMGRVLQGLSLLALFVGATCFVGSLRRMYFFEWRSAADVRAAYPVIQEVARRYGVHEIPTAWDYADPLTFYRVYFHEQNLDVFHWALPPPSGKTVYVLPDDQFQDFIRKEGLHAVYHGENTSLTILARGEPPSSGPAQTAK